MEGSITTSEGDPILDRHQRHLLDLTPLDRGASGKSPFTVTRPSASSCEGIFADTNLHPPRSSPTSIAAARPLEQSSFGGSLTQEKSGEGTFQRGQGCVNRTSHREVHTNSIGSSEDSIVPLSSRKSSDSDSNVSTQQQWDSGDPLQQSLSHNDVSSRNGVHSSNSYSVESHGFYPPPESDEFSTMSSSRSASSLETTEMFLEDLQCEGGAELSTEASIDGHYQARAKTIDVLKILLHTCTEHTQFDFGQLPAKRLQVFCVLRLLCKQLRKDSFYCIKLLSATPTSLPESLTRFTEECAKLIYLDISGLKPLPNEEGGVQLQDLWKNVLPSGTLKHLVLGPHQAPWSDLQYLSGLVSLSMDYWNDHGKDIGEMFPNLQEARITVQTVQASGLACATSLKRLTVPQTDDLRFFFTPDFRPSLEAITVLQPSLFSTIPFWTVILDGLHLTNLRFHLMGSQVGMLMPHFVSHLSSLLELKVAVEDMTMAHDVVPLLTALTHLDLYLEASASYIYNVVEPLRHLRGLTVNGAFTEFELAMLECTQLSQLDVSLIPSSVYCHLGFLRGFPLMRHLSLKFLKDLEGGANCALHNLLDLPLLTYLKLEFCKSNESSSDATPEHQLFTISGCRRLHSLDLVNMGITDEMLRPLSRLELLKDLRLGQSPRITKQFLPCISGLTNLTLIVLQGTGVRSAEVIDRLDHIQRIQWEAGRQMLSVHVED
eukprot:jgi/Botrbrau1/16131/Bobra.7_2s0090.1